MAGVAGAQGPRWVTFKDILFDFDQSNLRADEQSEIDRIVSHLKENPSITVGIDGHTDPRGTDRYNQLLSERRVGAIKGALMKAGVPAEKIETGAFGKSRPKCNDKSEACWQRDRRVEVLMSTNPSASR